MAGERRERKGTYAFYDASSDAGDCALDLFVARRAHYQRAAGVNGRKERVAVFQAML